MGDNCKCLPYKLCRITLEALEASASGPAPRGAPHLLDTPLKKGGKKGRKRKERKKKKKRKEKKRKQKEKTKKKERKKERNKEIGRAS